MDAGRKRASSSVGVFLLGRRVPTQGGGHADPTEPRLATSNSCGASMCPSQVSEHRDSRPANALVMDTTDSVWSTLKSHFGPE